MTIGLSALIDNTEPSFWHDPALEGHDIRHLVFVVHGMGRQLEERGKYRDNIRDMRTTLREVLNDEFQRPDEAIAVIPIEWHSILHEKVDSRMAKAALTHCSAMRILCNEYLADSLHYFTHNHGQMIIDVVVDQLNMRYDEFIDKYPGFTGSVVIVGFSLGGVCCYDILTRQPGGIVNPDTTDYRSVAQLKFQPPWLFTFGSPIAGVMVMRGWEMCDLQLPPWCRHQNITHPCDPLAYRIEPLIMEKYTDIPPVQIDHLPPRSRRQTLLDWMSPRTPGSFFPGVGYAYRFLSAFAGYMYGGSEGGSIKGDDDNDSEYDNGSLHGSRKKRDDEPVRHYRKRRRVSESSEESLWPKDTTQLLDDTDAISSTTATTTATTIIDNQCNDKVIIVSDDDEEEEEQEHLVHKNEVITTATTSINTITNMAETSELLVSNTGLSVEIIETTTIGGPDTIEQDYVHIDGDMAVRYATDDPKPLDQRIDFMLYEPRLRTLNEYVIGIRAHFSYWRNRDLMRHLLRCLGIHPIAASSASMKDDDSQV